MCEVSSLYAKRKWSYQAKTVKQTVKSLKSKIWPWFLTPNRDRSYPGHGQYILLYAKNKWIYHVETIQSVKTKYDLVLWSFDPQDPQNSYRSFSVRGQYICEVSLLYAKSEWSCGAETVKKFKSPNLTFDLFDPKSTEVLLRSRSLYMWSIIIVCQKTRGPRTFYRSPDNQQQTVQSEKKTTRMKGFK